MRSIDLIPEWLFLLNVNKTIIPNLECEPAYKAIWAAVNKYLRGKKNQTMSIMADNRKIVSALATVSVVALELLEEKDDELEVDTFSELVFIPLIIKAEEKLFVFKDMQKMLYRATQFLTFRVILDCQQEHLKRLHLS